MPLHLPKSKLEIPMQQTRRLIRQRLMDVLNESIEYKITLVSAPAGYGKTVALSEWAQTRKERAAWISLDESDDDPARVYYYIAQALQRFDPSIEADQEHLPAYPVKAINDCLIQLLNALGHDTRPFFMVIDDYHHIQNAAVHQMLALLIEYLPATVHVVISTRLDPPLDLDQMRIQNKLLEIRSDTLSFTSAEVRRFLNHTMGLEIKDDDVAALAQRTEGWIAGVHIASLVLKSGKNPVDFIQGFSGNHAQVMDYLVKETYYKQPADIRAFLLQSAILEHLNEPLCNAVTGRNDSLGLLRHLVANNLFIVQLDDQRRWFRYHHLFSDVLRSLLRQHRPQDLPELHRRASQWLEHNGELDEAIRHAYKAHDTSRVVSLIKRYAGTAFKQGERLTLRNWLERLPEGTLEAHPTLCVMHAWTLMNDKTAGADAQFDLRLTQAERSFARPRRIRDAGESDTTAPKGGIRAMIALLRAIFAFERGNPSRLFLEALQQSTENHSLVEIEFGSVMRYVIGHIQLRTSDLESAFQSFDDAYSLARARGNIYLALYAAYLKAWILYQRGKYHQAEHLCTTTASAFARRERQNKYGSPLREALKVILAAVHLQWHRPEAAEELLEQALVHLRRSTEYGIMINALLQLVSVKLVLRKKSAEVKQVITELETMARYHQNLRPLIHVLQMKLSARNGDFPMALKGKEILPQLLKLDPHAFELELSYYQDLNWRMTERLEFIQLHIRRHLKDGDRWDGRTKIHLDQYLEHLLTIADQLGLKRLKIEILATMAMAAEVSLEPEPALCHLEKALDLAAPEEALQPFADRIDVLHHLLKTLFGRKRFVDFISKILPPAKAPLPFSIETLSPRECEVLERIAQGYSNQEISSALHISMNTVKTHIGSIYGKLGVNKRTRAVSRAKEIGLLR